MIYMLFFLEVLVALGSTGSSSFRSQTIDSDVKIGYGIALGDVDGDKKPDILLADKNMFVWYRNGDWKKFVMAENLTEYDNVCIAAQDLNGDGKVEVAVGGQWNPSETKDRQKSGSIHFLIGPQDPTKTWKAITLYHEPTIHRMRWVRSSNGSFYLVVLPLHGKNNTAGAGEPVNLLVFQYPTLLKKPEPGFIIPTNMHLTHNLEIAVSKQSRQQNIFIAGKEGVGFIEPNFNENSKVMPLRMKESGAAGEVRAGNSGDGRNFITTIEPMHGNHLAVYSDDGRTRKILDTNLNEGHALIAADILGLGYDQVVAGWRRADQNGKVGIKLYTKSKAASAEWKQTWIDENTMACEDLQVIDLNADGKPEIVASGRATHNLKIYWNISGSKR